MKHYCKRAPATLCAVALASMLVGACGLLESDQIDYKSAGRGTSLEVPPDLTQLQTGSRYTIPGEAVTARSWEAGQAAQASAGPNIAPNAIADVHYRRDGAQRWLHVERPADKVWNDIRDFWLDNGFLLTEDQQVAGIMQTDWAENRARIPQDIIRRTIGKAFDSLYSTGERDRFRTRLERDTSGGVDVFITHQGMEEVYSSERQDSTVWQPRPRDMGLEAQMLRLLMVKLGVSEEESRAMMEAESATPAKTERARIVQTDGGGVQALQLDEPFDSAWRNVGLALDRAGFTVEDRDRSQGLYYVRYVDPTARKKDVGFFGRLLGRTSSSLPTHSYRISVAGAASGSVVGVQDENGNPAATDDRAHILQTLLDELK